MSKFNPSAKQLVVNELIEKGYTVDYDDSLRICHELEEEQQTHHKASIGLTAVGIIGAGVTLAFCGVVAPLLVPIAAITVGISGVWNHPIRATRRDDEAEFLRANPTLVPLIESRLQSGEAPFKVAAAYQECFRAWRNTGQPLALPSVGTPQSLPESNIVGTQTRLNAVETKVSNSASSFDWTALNRLYDDYPHLLLLGKTGAGKTFLSERLGKFLEGQTLVITPKKKPRDFQGLRVVGLPYDFAAIANEISTVAQLVKDREAEMNRTANEDFEPLNVILDEVPAFVAGCKDEGFDVVKDLKFIIRTARTSKIRLILLAQGSEVKTLGIEGEGSLRDNLTFIRLRGFAEPHAKSLGIDISTYDRPCLIDDVAADVNLLSSLADATKKETSTYSEKPAVTPKQNDEPTVYPTPVELLNKSFNLDAVTPDHEEAESAIEQTTDDIFTKFAATLNHESQANLKSFVLWLRKKRGEEVSFEQIKSSWAKNNNVGRGKETLMPLIYAAKSKKLLTLLTNSKWKVSE